MAVVPSAVSECEYNINSEFSDRDNWKIGCI